MKRFLLPLVILAFSAAGSAGQSAQPAPTGTPSLDDDVVKITTSLIQLDVTVTDKKGNPISDLRRDEIEIFENGKKQNISNMEFVRGVNTDSNSSGGRTDLISTPSTQRPERVRRTIALVVDDLSLSFTSTYWVKSALKKFVQEQIQDGDLVAIIRTGSGVGALQQFTTDRRQLLAAAERVKFNSVGSGIGLFNSIEPASRQPISRRGEAERDFEQDLNEFRESIFSAGTLGALNFIVRGMKDLPGRKSVVLLSDGMPLFFRNSNGLSQGSRMLFQLRRLTDLANRASVVVYTLDAKGMDVPMLSAADNTYDMSAGEIERELSNRSQSFIDSQSGLSYLAKQTGGMAIFNSNDINYGIRKVMNDQSYYLVGYEPDDSTFDPRTRRYNRLEIKVLREGAQVRYRSGFFGISDENIPKPNLTAAQALINALTSPFALNDIAVRVNSMFTADAERKTYLKTYLHLAGNDLTFAKNADGTYKTVFDVVALTFGDNGTIANEHSQTYTVTLGAESLKRVMEKGFVYDFALPIKKPGGVQMRVAVRDNATNKVGSANQFVEIPNLKKDRLTLSGIVFESMSLAAWAKVSADPSAYADIKTETDARTDTSLRQFRRGSAVRYGLDIYNSRTDASANRRLTKQIKLYRDGKEYFASEVGPVVSAGIGADNRSITNTGTIRLGPQMPVGEYLLQVLITDDLAKGSRRVASQMVAFDVVE